MSAAILPYNLRFPKSYHQAYYLLATTKENEENLEEIELSDKSETRKMIEKFVDENPEAVAMLLRNWINEDWG